MMKKILIVDDEGEFCSFIRDVLEITGKYKVIIALDGKGGVKAALDHIPDLILLDIVMPVMDGFQVLKMLKDDDRLQSIPVIMLTAKTDEESKVKASGLYGEAYLSKPVEIEKLRSEIDIVLSRH